ncbi:MAG: DUF1722 domain-containing protein [Candidatus Cloacimonetes bacterium HGW-Cloacimonetes-2]|nr:MAG: DUF1722 domain-containing protein [Candidatus Cloacimonetes bacterium HGW-Cloacimonetes-2]
MQEKPLLGISTCLLGHKVRYDGGHKYDNWLVETLGKYVDYYPVCPEVECGLSVPREAMRLVGDAADPLLLTIKTGIDHTARMKDWASNKLEDLAKQDLCAFVFKSKSPSSGMERVKVYPAKGGAASKTGIGIFARAFMSAFPLLPVEEEGRLHDPILRENFIERIFVVWRFKQVLAQGGSPKLIVEYHTRHKLLLMAHSPLLYRELGKLVASQKSYSGTEFRELYFTGLMQAMKLHATVAKHVNVLQHIMGYFKRELQADEKAELLEIITAFKAGLYPLIVPVTLLNHYIRKYDQSYLKSQYYLNPHPLELKLRNHS